MPRLRAMLYRLRGFFRRGSLEAEMQVEMQAHLDGLTERNITAGMSPEEARNAALREFGGVAQIAEQARDERRSVWLEQLGQDLRYAVRALAKSPSFTITAVLTLALGIGVNAALFSVFNMVALRSPVVKDPHSLVRIDGRNSRGSLDPRFSHAEYLAYRENNHTLDGLLAFHERYAPLQSKSSVGDDPGIEEGRADAVPIELVSENYFDLLGGPLQLGRTFRREEFIPGAEPVIVLSHAFWSRHFQSDPNVIGATLMLKRRVVTVIGVASPEFTGQRPTAPAGWLPLAFWSDNPEDYGPKGSESFKLIGRLKPGITEAQAIADLGAIASHRAKEFPGDSAKLSVRLERGLPFLVFTRTPQGLMAIGTLFLGFGLVLVIACTNVANLLLARGMSRQPEIGVRLTLGASRGRIIRQLLTENGLLCAIGAMAGLAFAHWTLLALRPIFLSQLPADMARAAESSAFFDTRPDLQVLGFTALLTMGASLVAGLLPAIHTAGTSPIVAIRNNGTAFGRGLSPSRLRQLLIITQVAVCLALLSCAGMLVRNLIHFRKLDVGFNASAVFSAGITTNKAIVDPRAARRQALETLRGIPGVEACGLSNRAPLLGSAVRPRIRVAEAASGGAEDAVHASFVTGGFFETFGVPLLRGRDFRESELQATTHAIVISEALARQLWPGQEAVGRMLAVSESAWTPRERPAPVDAFRDCEVIGVAGDVLLQMSENDRRLLYLPFAMERPGPSPLYIRPRSDSAAALKGIVRAAKAGGVELEFHQRHSIFVEQLVLPFYVMAILSGGLGALALGMASVGLYGLMTFTVNGRVHEIGVRMALGASAERVVVLFVRQGMKLVAVGLVLGLIGGGIFALLLDKIFFGIVKAFDPVAFVAVTLLFAAIAFFACWLPARRATKVDPMLALRAE